MTVVIRAVELTGGVITAGNPDVRGMFLKAYDPEAHDGRGSADWTRVLAEAMEFNDQGVAWMFWRQQSKTRPLRPDGKPNRPLTAFTIEVVNRETL